MSRRRSLWSAAVIAAVAAVSLASVAKAAPKVGQPAPDFTVTTFGGRTVRMADLKGNVILLNFWATWCAPCRVELPLLEGVFQAYTSTAFRCWPWRAKTPFQRRSSGRWPRGSPSPS